LRRVPIRMKLAGALVVPLFALVVVTVLEVIQSISEVDRISGQSALAEASIGPASLLSKLEDERNAASVFLLGDEAMEAFNLPIEDIAAARDSVSTALNELRSEVEAQGGTVEAAYREPIDGLAALDDLRVQVDAIPDGQRSFQNIDVVSGVFDSYTALMEPFFEANKRAALAVDDPDLRRGAELVDLQAQQTNLIAILTRDLLFAQLGGVAPDGVNTNAEIATIAGRLGQLRHNEQLIAVKATGDYREHAEALFAAEETQRFPEVVQEAIETVTVEVGDVITYSAGEDPETFGYTIFRTAATETLTERADELEAAAAARQRWFAMLALVALFVAGAMSWLVSRSITRPLRALTRQAREMAEHRLPEAVLDILETPLGEDVTVPQVPPVRVNTRDEVADVATALNTVQDTALDLAVEQAVLRRNIADSFVNLGRRNQNLLGRQLDFITELESRETEPDALSNLFRLDHLATRMRRNAESLLVLAGIEPPRQWAAPVRLTDVIRAALGEVEDYQRVTVRGIEPATIVGSAAADLAHLLAELIENALVFSPPDQTVDIRGRNRPARAAVGAENTSGYTLAIIDSGLGMPAGDIAAANRRLAGAESFTIAPSKYLGHYVAGNLGARHDIQVHLDNSPGNGITATVDLPPTLLTTDTDLAAPVTPPHGHDALALGTGQSPALPGAPPDAGDGGAPAWLTTPLPASRPPAGGGPAVRPLPTSAETSRTQSGLVKRSGRAGNGTTIGAGQPTGDLLDSLSRHTANLQGVNPPTGQGGWAPPAPPAGPGVPGAPGAPGAPGGADPWGPPTRPGDTGGWSPRPQPGDTSGWSPRPQPGDTSGWSPRPQPGDTGPWSPPTRPDDTGGWPSSPPTRRGDTGGWPSPLAPAPGPQARDTGGWPPSGEPTIPPANRGWPSPPAMPPLPEPPAPTWTPSPAPAGWAPAAPPTPADDRGWSPEPLAAPYDPSRPARSGPTGGGPGGGFGGGLADGFGGGPGDGFGGGHTSAGLTRRVRGAQLPNTQPVRMHRGPHDGVARPPTSNAPVLRTPEQRHKADDVYSFLSSFTAGVQRGLDEASGGDGGRG
jgi:HAMP domain-containing protein